MNTPRNVGKITVSLDEVNSTHVDAELHRQDVANRMAQHQEKIRVSFGGSGEMIGAKGGFFRAAMVYMAIFGIIFSVAAWGIGECIIKASNEHPWSVASPVIAYIIKTYPNASDAEFKRMMKAARDLKGQSDNPFFQDGFWEQSKDVVN